MALKETQIKNAKAKERPYKLADGEGLFLLVQPNGSRLWRLKYRYRGKEKLLSFGAYPDIGISTARELKTIARGTLAEGKDPMVFKSGRDFDADRTFKAVATRWHRNRESSLDPAHAIRVAATCHRRVLSSIIGITELPAGVDANLNTSRLSPLRMYGVVPLNWHDEQKSLCQPRVQRSRVLCSLPYGRRLP